jgi:hypothetical protein
MPAGVLEIDETHEPVVSVPRPRWWAPALVVYRVVVGLSVFVSAYVIYESVMGFTSSDSHRGFPTNLALLYLLVIVNSFQMFEHRLTARWPFAVFDDKIEIHGQKLPFVSITGCHWGRYQPDKLFIRMRAYGRNQTTIPIPKGLRSDVEAALRRFHKWDG